MSETILTKGWPGPKGLCDMCHQQDAKKWFGDTSVALCNDEKCAKICLDMWNSAYEKDDD